MSQMPNDIPGNSNKAKEQGTQNQTSSGKPEIVPFDGDVAGAKRNKSKFWAWMRKMFLSDKKPSQIALEVLENNVVPGIKDNLRNSLVSSLDMFIYQSSKPTNAQATNNIVSYNNIFRSQTVTKPTPPAPADNNNGMDLSNGFVNPCFKTRNEAERFLINKLKSYDYPTLSVHTMYLMMSKRIDYTWDAYGWTKEEIALWEPSKIIVHINSNEYPWMIDLPQAHLIS